MKLYQPLHQRILSRVVFYAGVLALLWTLNAFQQPRGQAGVYGPKVVSGLIASPMAPAVAEEIDATPPTN